MARTTKDIKEFQEYVMQSISYGTYLELHTRMGLGRGWTLRLLKNPGLMMAKHIRDLVQIINKPECTTEFLVNTFKCGREVLTIAEMESLTSETIM